MLEGHPGLAAVFAITFDELGEEEQQAFRTLSLFAPGPLWLVHIAAVAALEESEAESQLDGLVQRALLSWGDAKGEYILHPLLRDFGRTLLEAAGEIEEGQDRHLHYFVAYARADQTKTVENWNRLDAVLPDLMAAINHAEASSAYESLRNLGHALYRNSEFLPTRRYQHEAKRLLTLMANACLALDDEEGQATALGNLGLVAMDQGDYEAAKDYHGQALSLHTELGDLQGQAIFLGNLGLLAMDHGDHEAAKDYLVRSAESYQSMGLEEPPVVRQALDSLSNIRVQD